jgi:hypothetical protein
VDRPSREWKVELHHLERKIPKVSSFGIFLLSLHYGRKNIRTKIKRITYLYL